MEPAPAVGGAFFPLDEELGLLPGTLAPRQQEHLVHLASCLPFAQAAEMLGYLLQVQVSEETARRLTEQAGARVEADQTAQAKAPEQESAARTRRPARLVISADGACVPLLHGEWAEVRTLALGEVTEPQKGEEAHEVHVRQLSYFSRLTDADSFAELAEVEMRRRQVVDAQEVGAVMDGADWLQSFVDLHRHDAVRILDFPHAAQHVAALLQALTQAGLVLPADMLHRCLHVLKQRGPHALREMAKRLPPEVQDADGVREHLNYLCKREALMHYPQMRKQGWPIGSGMVESANKLVVQARLKGAGMHWHRTNVNPMLALRNGICNERWQEVWRTSVTQARCDLAQRRAARGKLRAQSAAAMDASGSDAGPSRDAHPTSPPPPCPLLPPEPAATLPGSSRPSPHHPWKKTPACTPKAVAKS